MKYTRIILIVLMLCALSMSTMAQQTVSIETLLNDMVDRDSKARYPMPEFTCKQFSSYDRATTKKGDFSWFANSDRTMFLRVEKDLGRTEYVMMDSQGPGAIVRFWMTFAGKDCGLGTLRIYIDDMTTPIISGRAFDVLSGNTVTGAPLASSVSELTDYNQRGHNLYFPIPYSKRCKVTYESENVFEDDFGAKKESSECVYYNINYRTYEPSTNVISFSPSQMKKNSSLIAKIQKQLKESQRIAKGVKLSSLSLDTELAAGASKSFTIDNANAIRHIGMQLEAANKEQALRSIVMEMSFDGQKTVWVPVGDFFGIGYKQIYTNTWYTSASNEGKMDAYWVMPFKGKCVITLNNYGEESVKIKNATADYGKWSWDDRSMYFGSSWHQYSSIDVGGPKHMNGDTKGLVDLNFVGLKGKGVYVGDGIALFNTTFDWWGEGDEKIFVDGESFPSHIGTGTEDYYGYAWCRPEKFTDHPFIAQPCGDGSFNTAYSTNTRLRALDVIPFKESLEFDMELWHWSSGQINYAPVTFWYVLPGGASTIEPDIEGVQHKVALKRNDIMSDNLRLTIEAENMTQISIHGGHLRYQFDMPHMWSKGMQLYWRNVVAGSKLTMSFNSPFETNCNIEALCTTAPDYGIVNIYLNGKLLCSNVDLYAQKLDVKIFNLGRADVAKGENRIMFELVKFTGQGQKGCIGIDQITFIP